MIHLTHTSARRTLPILLGVCLLALFAFSLPVGALEKIPDPDPKPGSYGLEATKTKAPPTSGATITTPGNGASFSSSPITVNGICPDGLLVQIFNNGVMVGSAICKSGSFGLEISLFAGVNELSALVFDEIDQSGPASNVVTVNYADTNFTAFGELITLTSAYGRRSAPVGTSLGWPLQLSGGTGPYAFNIDWGDGSKPELRPQALSGQFTIDHVYKRAGIYQVNITVTDANGVSAFLQIIAVSSGEVTEVAGSAKGDVKGIERVIILWIPAAIALLLLFPAYWLGRRSQLVSLRTKMLKDRDNYQER